MATPATLVNPAIPVQMETTGPTIQRQEQFTVKNLTIGENSLRAPYRRRAQELKKSIHWGQRKLLLSEIEFFTTYWDSKLIPRPLCVYAGAAAGMHIPLLAGMFPAFTFHLYDPAKFAIQPTDRIQIFNVYFTDEVAARYAGRNDVFFISDIRTADYRAIRIKALAKRGITEFKIDEEPIGPLDLVKEGLREADLQNEEEIWGDMTMQQRWVQIINPAHALLKFRLPYALDGLDRTVQYLKGIVYWQVWAPQTSTETRLKPLRNEKGVYEMMDWSILEYEQWNFHHNIVDREQIFYTNIFTGTTDPVDPPELLNDYDSMAEAFILRLYFEKLGKDPNTQVKKFSRIITWSINKYHIEGKTARTLEQRRAAPGKFVPKKAPDAFRAKPGAKAVVPPTRWQRPAAQAPPRQPVKPVTPTITVPRVAITVAVPTAPITVPIPTPVAAPVIIPVPAPVLAPIAAITPAPTTIATKVPTPRVPAPAILAPVAVARPAIPTVTVARPAIPTPTATIPRPMIPTPTATVVRPVIPTPTATVVRPVIPTATIPRPVIPTPGLTIPRPAIPTPTATVPRPAIPALTGVIPRPGGVQ